MKLDQFLITDNWPRRRRWMSVALIWLAGNVQYILIKGADTAVNQQALTAMIAAFVSIICFYVFGAVWDDNSKRAVLATSTKTEGPEEPAL